MPVSCGHCHQKHDTVQQVKECSGVARPTQIISTMNMKQQKFLGDLMSQFDLVPDGDWTINTIPYRDGQAILSGLIDARRFKATGKPYSFPPGVRINPHPSRPAERTPTRRPMPDVPAGHYAVPSKTGNNDFDFYRVKRTETGRTYVKVIIGGHPEYGLKFGPTIEVLERIIKFGIEKSGWTYGQEVEQCRYCNHRLTEYASRKLSMGPDCAEQHGLGQEWRIVQASRPRGEE